MPKMCCAALVKRQGRGGSLTDEEGRPSSTPIEVGYPQANAESGTVAELIWHSRPQSRIKCNSTGPVMRKAATQTEDLCPGDRSSIPPHEPISS